MRTTLTLGVVALLLAGGAACADDRADAQKADVKAEAAKLMGTYTVTAGEKFGQKEPADRIAGIVVRFTEDRVAVTDKDKKAVYTAGYTLDTSQRPIRILLTSTEPPTVGQVSRGLVERDGETVKLIYALPGAEAPTDFKTKDNQLMFVLKRAEAKDKQKKQ
jgi:uncharacterized protein (TIGR03067 family)